MKPKIIAFYLPQFYTFPENDEWWGKGFTDWVNVKKAKPLFEGHEQPKEPLDDRYYDLSKPETLYWQASLANKYNVYGMCFYHYWFDGKLLLEKPAENLISDKNIPMKFCFSWANEPWARTWDGKNKSILMPQSYGNENDWVRHFNYLLPFFKDSRYIKEQGCPMFLIYKSASIPCAEEMMLMWDKLAKEAGFNGMHFVETLRGKNVDPRKLPFKAKVEFEPICANMQQGFLMLNYKRARRYTIKFINKVFHTKFLLNKPLTFKEVANRSLASKFTEHTYGGLFVGWDNTARRELMSTIVLPPTKKEFFDYAEAKIKKTAQVYKTSYVFVNAWNEWAEGTVLEPDKRNKYSYLEVIKKLSEREF